MTKNPKIAFVGTSCVGKTTLLGEYSARQDDRLLISTEVARWFLRGVTPDERKFTYTVQASLQDAIMRQEAEIDAEGTGLILCDRSVLDPASYLMAWGKTLDSRRLLERVKTWIPTYTHLFLLDPIDVEYFNDDVRTEDKDVRNRMHITFQEILDDTKLPYELLSGSLEERVAVVDRKIEELLS